SSGMSARLGFAVATAHIPEILILDEILSVGDEAFQKKSRDRLQNFQKQGATVIMVSHGLDSMIAMCDRLVWLDHGSVRMIGEPVEVVAAYRGENL
ncbi:MAG TPA: sugar ABC transporter ATP-binding protein, partial [Anaerolineaceae bacterium]|nr:sugar ABC transporter ATP-binding protein [Anaerolineaceae bacterium]